MCLPRIHACISNATAIYVPCQQIMQLCVLNLMLAIAVLEAWQGGVHQDHAKPRLGRQAPAKGH